MLLSSHTPLLLTAVCLVCCWSATTAFAFSSPATVKHSYARDITSTSLYHSINRRSVFTIAPLATFTTLLIPPGHNNEEQYHAHADEPNNMFYKSKADEEDPLAVFGRSLQQSITTDGNNGVQQQPDSSKEGVDTTVTEQQQSLPQGGDLGRALMEKQQQRRIDPRTHG